MKAPGSSVASALCCFSCRCCWRPAAVRPRPSDCRSSRPRARSPSRANHPSAPPSASMRSLRTRSFRSFLARWWVRTGVSSSRPTSRTTAHHRRRLCGHDHLAAHRHDRERRGGIRPQPAAGTLCQTRDVRIDRDVNATAANELAHDRHHPLIVLPEFFSRRLGYVAHSPPPRTWLYPDRTPGRDCHHWRPHRPALARGAEGPRGRQPRQMLQQPQTGRAALANYESTNQHFPISGYSSSPKNGWVAYILPYIEQQNVLNTYDLTQDWNAAANSAAIQTPIAILNCPSTPARTGTTWVSGVAYAGATWDYTNISSLSSSAGNPGTWLRLLGDLRRPHPGLRRSTGSDQRAAAREHATPTSSTARPIPSA